MIWGLISRDQELSLSQSSGLTFFLNNRSLSFVDLMLYFEIISNFGEFKWPWEQLPDHFHPDSPAVNCSKPTDLVPHHPQHCGVCFPPKQGNSLTLSPFNPPSQEATDLLYNLVYKAHSDYTSCPDECLFFCPEAGSKSGIHVVCSCHSLSKFLYSRTSPSSFPVFQILV